MLENRLGEALGDISDAKLESAMGVYERKRRKRTFYYRLAAIAAAVAILITAIAIWPADENYVTGPGMLVIRAYGAEYENDIPVEGVILEEGVEFEPGFRFNPAQSYTQYVPFAFAIDETLYPNMNITLEVNVNAGIFYKMDPFDPSLLEMTPIEQLLATYHGQHFTVDIGKTIYWDPWGFDYEYMREQYEKGEKIFDRAYIPYFLTNNPSFIDVIIRADDMIIGYCVIEIRLLEGEIFEVQEFTFELLTMVSFPKVDGRWQKVTEEYVQKEINKIHAENEK